MTTNETFDPDARLPLGVKLPKLKPEHSEDDRLPLGTKVEHIPTHNPITPNTVKPKEVKVPEKNSLHDLIKSKVLSILKK